jgi:hypothetical protein
MPQLDSETQKQVIKEALQEWLDKQFATLGRWTVGGLCSMALAVLVYLYLSQQGWSK